MCFGGPISYVQFLNRSPRSIIERPFFVKENVVPIGRELNYVGKNREYFNLSEACMGKIQRLALAVGVVVLDALVFVVPLTALFMAYIIVVNPPWFREFLFNLDGPGENT